MKCAVFPGSKLLPDTRGLIPGHGLNLKMGVKGWV